MSRSSSRPTLAPSPPPPSGWCSLSLEAVARAAICPPRRSTSFCGITWLPTRSQRTQTHGWRRSWPTSEAKCWVRGLTCWLHPCWNYHKHALCPGLVAALDVCSLHCATAAPCRAPKFCELLVSCTGVRILEVREAYCGDFDWADCQRLTTGGVRDANVRLLRQHAARAFGGSLTAEDGPQAEGGQGST